MSDDVAGILNEALLGSYVLQRPIGEGGMATVYLAQDLKHQRPVALKVLKPELAHSLGPERFRREITTAARLQHPHILSVHDSGETKGQFWFTMPFVDGESLRDRLKRERCLPLDEALRITREAAAALQYAHEHGIIHRDIKPENLLLTRDGFTLVADFGIARALSSDGIGANTTGESLTQTGTSIGTPTYMAPEQATGEKTIDARADQYSLAATLYEMLAGEPPFTASTGAALIAKRFSSPTPSVQVLRPEVPPLVDQALQQGLALRAKDRFATIREFSRAVTQTIATPSSASSAALATVPGPAVTPSPKTPRRVSPILVGLGVVALLGAGTFLLRRPAAAPSPPVGVPAPSVNRLAVLPFENLGDTADAYFADGIADELRGKLTAIPGLEVIARGSSVQYRGTTKSQQEIAKELGVRYLLTGTVRWEKSGSGKGRVRVSPELIEVSPNGAPASKWQQPFDAPLTDVFQVQGDIAEKVAGALDVALGTSTQRTLAARPTKDLEAYDLFLRAEAAWQNGAGSSAEELQRAAPLYEEAVKRDSAFALAWSRLALVRGLYYNNVAPSPALGRKVREAADRAIALGPDEPDAIMAQATYERFVNASPRRAVPLLETGLKRWPGNADLMSMLGTTERESGDLVTAKRHLEQAKQLDPRSALTTYRLGGTALWLRDYATAREAMERSYALAPSAGALQDRVMVEVAAGDMARARTLLQDGIARFGRASVAPIFSYYWDMYWLLAPEDQRYVLAMTAEQGFAGEQSTRALTFAQMYDLLGDAAKTRMYADSARILIAAELRDLPDDGQRNVLYGLALAFLGRRDEAIAAGERGVKLSEDRANHFQAAYNRHQLARIYLELGEQDRALDLLERLLREPYYLSPAWLREDQTLAKLRGNPRFEKLASQ